MKNASHVNQRSLTLYDVIVDIIPGIVAISVVWTFYPALFKSSFNTGVFASTIGLLAFSYVIGRLVHGVSGLSCLEDTAAKFIGILPWVNTAKPYRKFENRLGVVLTADGSDSEDNHDAPLETRLAEETLDQLGEEFDIDLQNLLRESADSSSQEELPVDDGEYTRLIADSRLYPLGELSWKYSLLATFFRNTWLILGVAALFYGYAFAQLSAGGVPNILPTPRSIDQYRLLFLATLAGAVISLKERFKFKRRQIRTLLVELHDTTRESP